MPRAATSVATNTLTAPCLNSSNACSRLVWERSACIASARSPVSDNAAAIVNNAINAVQSTAQKVGDSAEGAVGSFWPSQVANSRSADNTKTIGYVVLGVGALGAVFLISKFVPKKG